MTMADLYGKHDFITNHFDEWARYTLPDEERDEIEAAMTQVVADDPDLLFGEHCHSWPEIRQMAGY